jgi:hypothetical protein
LLAGKRRPRAKERVKMRYAWLLLIFLVGVGFLALLRAVRRKGHWTGTVVDIKEDSFFCTRYGARPTEVVIAYRRDDGKKGKLRLYPGQLDVFFPDGIKVGDRLVKEEGDDMPKVVHE